MKKAICYYRVSTKQQGRSGLGLEAQQQSVQSFLSSSDFIIEQEFTEVETGKKSDRPILQRALTACIKHKAVLIIARLDRLSRNVAFISALKQSKVEFIAVDMPYADKFFIHIMAAYAEYERDQASKRTTAALKAAKERGIELGIHGKHVLSVKNKTDARYFARHMQPIIDDITASGIHSIRKISKELNERKIPTYRGRKHKWHSTTVFNLMKRHNQLKTKNSET